MDLREVKVFCPICKREIGVDLSNMDWGNKQRITVTLVHGEPRHAILAYVNRDGKVLAVEPIKQTIVLGVEEKTKVIRAVSINELVELFGAEAIAQIVTEVLSGEPVYFISGKKYEWALEIATSIAIDIKLDVSIQVNKLGKSKGFYVIDEDFYKKNFNEIDKYPLFSTTGGLINKKHPLNRRILDNILKRVGKRKKRSEDLSDLFI